MFTKRVLSSRHLALTKGEFYSDKKTPAEQQEYVTQLRNRMTTYWTNLQEKKRNGTWLNNPRSTIDDDGQGEEIMSTVFVAHVHMRLLDNQTLQIFCYNTETFGRDLKDRTLRWMFGQIKLVIGCLLNLKCQLLAVCCRSNSKRQSLPEIEMVDK